MTRQESPLFTRLHDLQLWLMKATRRFPRDQRFVLARRIQQQAFAVEDALVAAAVDRAAVVRHLLWADIALTGLRRSLLLASELGHLSDGQYRHVAGIMAEIGRLLGGWRKRAG